MTHTCPGCGFVSGAEARYCRMCGTPLPPAAVARDDGGGYDSVSPNADTAPRRGVTEHISPHDTASPTLQPPSRVGRDFEEFRRRAEATHARLSAEAESSPTLQPSPS